LGQGSGSCLDCLLIQPARGSSEREARDRDAQEQARKKRPDTLSEREARDRDAQEQAGKKRPDTLSEREARDRDAQEQAGKRRLDTWSTDDWLCSAYVRARSAALPSTSGAAVHLSVASRVRSRQWLPRQVAAPIAIRAELPWERLS
jgi:hypothetical protein